MGMENLIILGSGPAGLTAGIYASRAGLNPLVLEGMESGGQLVQTSEIENFPGFENPVAGMGLMDAMRRQAERCGVRFKMDAAQGVDFTRAESSALKISTMMGETLECRALIVATGATARWTGAPGEGKYRSRGISACATCDGAFFKGKRVAVIGGGDTALGDALYLSRMASHVTIIHRRDAFRASKVMVERVLADEGISIEWNSTVAEFLGDGRRLSGLLLENRLTHERREIAVDGAFVAIGHEPQTKFLADALKLDDAGYIVADKSKTGVEGVFAAGDCQDGVYRQAVVAAGSGAIAALEAERYLS